MAGLDAKNYMVTNPVRECGANLNVKGITLPTFTYLSNQLVPNCNVYLEISWVYQMPEPAVVIPKVHAHPYEQITMLMGSDPSRPEYLGGEVESTFDGHAHTINKSNVIFIPKNVEHGHLTWKKFERPHMMMSLMLGTGSFWQANPGALNEQK